MEQVMSKEVEQDVLKVINTVTTIVESPAFQALVPVVLGALKVGGASTSPVAAGAFGAQLLADLAAALPVITPEVLQAGASLVGAVVKTVNPNPPPHLTVTGDGVTLTAPQVSVQGTVQVPTINGQVTQ
jgi:hypothetical protein